MGQYFLDAQCTLYTNCIVSKGELVQLDVLALLLTASFKNICKEVELTPLIYLFQKFLKDQIYFDEILTLT